MPSAARTHTIATLQAQNADLRQQLAELEQQRLDFSLIGMQIRQHAIDAEILAAKIQRRVA